LSIDEARTELSKISDLRDVIEAAESGDIAKLRSLAVEGGDGYCATGRDLPPECNSRDEKLPSVMLNQPRLRPVPVRAFDELVTPLIKDGGGLILAFATRDSRTPEGDGGEYYFMFETREPVEIAEGFRSNGIELKVKVGAEKPIQWFEFAAEDVNPLAWLQSMGENNDGARHHILITPETVDGWRSQE
jgi:hypothetical protein